jgi:hypothetical protein
MIRSEHPRKPSRFQWYVSWPLDDLREQSLTALQDLGVPALMLTDLEVLPVLWRRAEYSYSLSWLEITRHAGPLEWLTAWNEEAEAWLS